MAQAQGSDSDTSYDPDNDSDISDSEDSLVSEDEYDSDTSLISLEGGWSRVGVGVFDDARPDPLPPIVQAYSGVNPASGIDRNISVMECVKKFISFEVATHVIECTNERAKVFFEAKPDLKGKVNGLIWRNVNIDEFYVFLALYMYTGICKYSEVSQYWSRKPYIPGIHFYCAANMSRDRYLSIMKFLRFTMPDHVKKGVPSTRLDTFTDRILVPMMETVDAGKRIAIDEALVLWKGRLGFRQFIKSKRSRFGVKVFVMCNSEKEWSGYCYNFSVYYGKQSTENYVLPNVPGVEELSVSEKIVVHLANSVLGQGRHIFVDNWYSSYRLASFLLTQDTLMTGTIKSNRGVPGELVREKLEGHQASFVRKDNCMIVKWLDKKDVFVISTCFDSSVFVEKKLTLPGGKNSYFTKPGMIEEYNGFMGG